VLHAVRHGSALGLLETLYGWLAVREPHGLDRTLTPLEAATPDAGAACAQLERQLFRGDGVVSSATAWATIFRRARRALGDVRRHPHLDALNPASTRKGELS